MELKRSNAKAFEQLDFRLKELDTVIGKVGWFETSKYENGTPVAYVAAIQEMGSPANSIPARSFFRTTAQEQKQKWAVTASKVAMQVLLGYRTATEAMTIIADQARGDVIKKISSITDPKLSPITLELRAMKKKNPGIIITGATVGIAAAKVKQPGYVTPDVSTKPLVDTGLLVDTIDQHVEVV